MNAFLSELLGQNQLVKLMNQPDGVYSVRCKNHDEEVDIVGIINKNITFCTTRTNCMLILQKEGGEHVPDNWKYITQDSPIFVTDFHRVSACISKEDKINTTEI